MSRFQLGALFGEDGVSPKYRQHAVGQGYPVAGYHDQPAEAREPFLLAKGQKLKGKVTVQARQFDLSKPDELKEYAEARDRIANRLWIVIDRRVWTNPQTGDLKIFLEWAVPEYIRPAGDPPAPPAEYRPTGATPGGDQW